MYVPGAIPSNRKFPFASVRERIVASSTTSVTWTSLIGSDVKSSTTCPETEADWGKAIACILLIRKMATKDRRNHFMRARKVLQLKRWVVLFLSPSTPFRAHSLSVRLIGVEYNGCHSRDYRWRLGNFFIKTHANEDVKKQRGMTWVLRYGSERKTGRLEG